MLSCSVRFFTLDRSNPTAEEDGVSSSTEFLDTLFWEPLLIEFIDMASNTGEFDRLNAFPVMESLEFPVAEIPMIDAPEETTLLRSAINSPPLLSIPYPVIDGESLW